MFTGSSDKGSISRDFNGLVFYSTWGNVAIELASSADDSCIYLKVFRL